MIEPKTKYTGVIMAGGKSNRMGSDKGLMLYNGKPMVQYSIDLLRPFCVEMLISTQNSEYRQFGLPLIPDEIPNCGPMGGIYSALKASKTDFIIVLACDMPFMSKKTIQSLLKNVDKFECVIPLINGKLEPLCAVYSKTIIEKIEISIKSGNLAMNRLIMESKNMLICLKNNINDFQNINTPNELNGLFRQL